MRTYAGPGALVVALALSALLRGLYFRADQLGVGVVVLLLAAGVLLSMRLPGKGMPGLSILDVAAAGFALVAWASVLWAVEPRVAVQEALVASLALLLYAYARASIARGVLVHGLLVTFGLVAVATWLMAAGIWNYPSSVLANRLSGPFQYPDTAGAVLLASWFFAFFWRRRAEGRPLRLAWAALAGLSAYLFVLTISRGAMLAAPIALAAMLVVAKPGERIGLFVEVVVVGLAAFLLGGRVSPYLNNTGSPQALLYGFVMLFVGVVVGEALDQAHERRLDRWQVALAALAAVLVLAAAYLVHRAQRGLAVAGSTPVTIGITLPPGSHQFALSATGSGTGTVAVESGDRFGDFTTVASLPLGNGTGRGKAVLPPGVAGVRLVASAAKGSFDIHALTVDGKGVSIFWAKALPQSIYHRLLGFSATDLSVWERIDFWKDGWRMFLQRPVLGWGGGAWQVIYRAYQSFNYSSNEAHSHVVADMVSYGVLGLALDLLVAAGLVLALVRSKGRGDEGAAMLVAGLALWLHALIDFDLSLASVLFLLWCCLAGCAQVPLLRLPRPAPALVVRLLGVVSGGLAVWAALLLTAAGPVGAASPTQADLQQAVNLDPLSAQAHYRLAVIQVPKGNLAALTQPTVLFPVLTQLSTAYALDPYSEQYAVAYAQALLNDRQVAQGLSVLQVALRDAPMDPTAYANVENIATTLGGSALAAKDATAARSDYLLAWRTYRRYLAERRSTEAVAPPDLQLPAPPAPVLLYAGEALAVLHRPGAVPLLRAAQQGGQTLAEDWLAALGQAKLPASQYQYEKQLLTLGRTLGL